MLDFFKSKRGAVLTGVLLSCVFYLAFAAVFAAICYFLSPDRSLIPLFSNISLAAAVFLSVWLVTKKTGDRGLMTGLAVGGIVFVIIVIISVFLSNKVSLNTLFHFLFIMLPAAIGGILGVNKSNKIM